MCNRFGEYGPIDLLVEKFGVNNVQKYLPSYNVRPETTASLVVSPAPGVRALAPFRWGFVHADTPDPKKATRPTNARHDKLLTYWRDAFTGSRCIIPADCVYEFPEKLVGTKKRKLPYRVFPTDGQPMGIAGLWDVWKGPDGERLFTFALITVDPNEVFRSIPHDRMPAVLRPEDYATWLNPEITDSGVLLPLVRTMPSDELQVALANPAMNKTKDAITGPECLVPPPGLVVAEEQPDLFSNVA